MLGCCARLTDRQTVLNRLRATRPGFNSWQKKNVSFCHPVDTKYEAYPFYRPVSTAELKLQTLKLTTHLLTARVGQKISLLRIDLYFRSLFFHCSTNASNIMVLKSHQFSPHASLELGTGIGCSV